MLSEIVVDPPIPFKCTVPLIVLFEIVGEKPAKEIPLMIVLLNIVGESRTGIVITPEAMFPMLLFIIIGEPPSMSLLRLNQIWLIVLFEIVGEPPVTVIG